MQDLLPFECLPVVLEGRDPQDRYYSPDWVSDALAHWVHEPNSRLRAALVAASRCGILEPSAGGGSLLRGLYRLMVAERLPMPPRVVACDLDPRPDRDLGFPDVEWVRADFRDLRFGNHEFGLCLQNPPFRLARESIELGRQCAQYTQALLRLTFVESQGRAEWLSQDAPDLGVLAARPNFRGATHKNGGDMVTCSWMLWGPCRRPIASFRVLPC